jgi:aminoglycoside phosphotransferase (APT) family kinase protein
VALKILPQDLAGNPDRLSRFQREARAVAALNHPNIVTIFSVEEDAGQHFITMELVKGQPLDQAIPVAADNSAAGPAEAAGNAEIYVVSTNANSSPVRLTHNPGLDH